MSKYDFELNLSLNSSTGLILSKLRPGSVILEFGCAAGRMTRYMKEKLGCRVYIVEYDEAAFQKASQYAEDGICDDIQNYRWAEQFREIAFDAVVLADVLEHLTQPEKVLKEAAHLLKEDGDIYLSVPNITHNDILLKMCEERFDYTQTGLLDDTHLHFWGLENLKELGAEVGLNPTCIEGANCTVGLTEQNVQLGKNRLLENLLRERQSGEVYQFVVTLKKGSRPEPVCHISAPTAVSLIYLDTGRSYNAEECIAFESIYSGKGSYLAHYTLTDVENVRSVRLDPAEFQGVILRSVSICQNGEEKTIHAPNAVKLPEGLYLPGDDPMVYAQVNPDHGSITLDAEFILPGLDYLRILEKTVCENQITQPELEQRNNNENSQLVADVGAYIVLTNKKEKLLIERERQCAEYAAALEEKEKIINDTVQQCAEYAAALEEKEKIINDTVQQRAEYAALAENRGAYIVELEKYLTYYQNLRVVKIRALVSRILRKIKRCVMKLLGRG